MLLEAVRYKKRIRYASTKLDHSVGHSRNPDQVRFQRNISWKCCLLQNSLYDVKKISPSVS